MKRAGFFDLLKENKTQAFLDHVNELLGRCRFRPELGKARNRSARISTTCRARMLPARRAFRSSSTRFR